MSVFKRFEQTDFIQSVTVASPQFHFASGSGGWRGNVGVSASISMFDGVRARAGSGNVSVRPIFRRDSNAMIGGPVDVSGSYPLSASIKLVQAHPTPSAYDATSWGEEHWDVLGPLYEWHSRYNSAYTTASYDRYSLFFARSSTNVATRTGADTTPFDTLSSSFTIEMRAKPFSVLSAQTDFTLASRDGHFYLGVTGSTGRLVFSGSYMGVFTSSFGPDIQRWSHLTVRGTNGTGSFLVDLVDAGTFTYTGSMARLQSLGVSTVAVGNVAVTASAGSTNRSFHGLIGDTRLWSVYRSDQQLSASFNKTLFASGSSAGLVAYYRMNQGPRYSSTVHAAGSGVLDHSVNVNHMTLGSYTTRVGPVWQPNDDSEFISPKDLANQQTPVDTLRIVNIPSLFYGRQIATGSVEIACRTFSTPNVALVRTIVDDGRGSLYISGSLCSSSLESKESYEGVRAQPVGSVFYSEGLIVISDPSMLDVGTVTGGSSHLSDVFALSFRGETQIPTKVIMCRADAGEMNVSNNLTFSWIDPVSGKRSIDPEQATYITSVGIYDAKHRLVAVAKLAQPIRKRLRDRECIRLRYDF